MGLFRRCIVRFNRREIYISGDNEVIKTNQVTAGLDSNFISSNFPYRLPTKWEYAYLRAESLSQGIFANTYW